MVSNSCTFRTDEMYNPITLLFCSTPRASSFMLSNSLCEYKKSGRGCTVHDTPPTSTPFELHLRCTFASPAVHMAHLLSPKEGFALKNWRSSHMHLMHLMHLRCKGAKVQRCKGVKQVSKQGVIHQRCKKDNCTTGALQMVKSCTTTFVHLCTAGALCKE